MKSIMEEASSISKAIEQAWNRAGKPQEFKVKIFEEPQRNMLGFTTKPAKIAFFFDEQHVPVEGKKPQFPQKKYTAQPHQPAQQPDKRQHPQYQPRPQQQQAPQRPVQPRPEAHVKQQPAAPMHTDANRQQQQPRPQQPRQRSQAVWADDAVAAAQNWIQQTLQHLGLANITFTSNVDGNLLHVQFSSPIVENEGKERMLFSSFAHLIILTVRHVCKRQLGNLKVVLKSR